MKEYKIKIPDAKYSEFHSFTEMEQAKRRAKELLNHFKKATSAVIEYGTEKITIVRNEKVTIMKTLKPGELRIGNYISVVPPDLNPFDEDIEQIAEIGKEVKTTWGNGWGYDEIYRIPLTEKWLNDLGFGQDKETESWSILVAMGKVDYCFEISNKYQEHFRTDFLSFDIKYVHQLQNLFFALTGVELER